jgi:biotin transporter BioY
MMNRIWKRTLYKLIVLIAVMAYLFAAVLGFSYLAVVFGYAVDIAVKIGAVIALAIPVAVFIVYCLYEASKEEIEREDLNKDNLFK